MHWIEHPTFFLKTLDQYASHQAIIFDGLDFGQVFFLLMRKRYSTLARHMVNLNGAFSSDTEAMALLQRRTMRITTPTTAELVC